MFSKSENRVIGILNSHVMSIADITNQFYHDEKPFNANNRVAAILRRIQAKCEHYNLSWTIDGRGAGRRGKDVWITTKTHQGGDMKLKKVAYKKEPKLHVHRYIVTSGREVGRGKNKKWKTTFHYCVNWKEVREFAKSQPEGTLIEVYKAEHNFVQAYERA